MPVSPAVSAQYALGSVEPVAQVPSSDWGSKLRASYAKLTLTAAGQGDAKMIRLPAGKVRIHALLSRIDAPQGAAASTISVGLGAYTKKDGSAAAADVDALLTATSTAAGVLATALLGTAAGNIQFVDVESKSGVDVTITAAGGNTAAAGDVVLSLVFQMGN